jgi:hypothetical protein
VTQSATRAVGDEAYLLSDRFLLQEDRLLLLKREGKLPTEFNLKSPMNLKISALAITDD